MSMLNQQHHATPHAITSGSVHLPMQLLHTACHTNGCIHTCSMNHCCTDSHLLCKAKPVSVAQLQHTHTADVVHLMHATCYENSSRHTLSRPCSAHNPKTTLSHAHPPKHAPIHTMHTQVRLPCASHGSSQTHICHNSPKNGRG